MAKVQSAYCLQFGPWLIQIPWLIEWRQENLECQEDFGFHLSFLRSNMVRPTDRSFGSPHLAFACRYTLVDSVSPFVCTVILNIAYVTFQRICRPWGDAVHS